MGTRQGGTARAQIAEALAARGYRGRVAYERRAAVAPTGWYVLPEPPAPGGTLHGRDLPAILARIATLPPPDGDPAALRERATRAGALLAALSIVDADSAARACGRLRGSALFEQALLPDLRALGALDPTFARFALEGVIARACAAALAVLHAGLVGAGAPWPGPLTTGEAAAHLRVDELTVQRLVQGGILVGARVDGALRVAPAAEA